MDPHKRTLRFPFFENIALRKPRGRAMVMRFASNIPDLPTDLAQTTNRELSLETDPL